MLEHILVCSDGSEQALKAAQIGEEIAKRFGSEVLLLGVLPLAPYTQGWELGIDGQVLKEWAEQVYGEIRQKTLPLFEQAGVPCRFQGQIGQPVQTIANIAASEHAGLIVLGCRGLSAWKALLLGSVSEGVLHHASCPVLIVHGSPRLDTQAGFRRILLATDGSDCACKAAQMAAQLAGKYDAELVALNVFQPHAAYPGVSNENLDPEVYGERVRSMVAERTAVALGKMDGRYTFRQETGHPAEKIVQIAAAEGFDLIVLGRRGLGGFKAMLLGSVSDGVAHHAPCPVLVVR
ncbi:MAG TPA: universal stress protein [Chthonomonadaceae bacterium]|nr:universal stress protein [Chthonomonadaceae bacterium]